MISRAWLAVWRRNFLVWRKLAAESVTGNIIEPLLYLVGFGFGFGSMLPEVEGVRYIAYLAGGTICYSTMLAASFEALYSGFSRMRRSRIGCRSTVPTCTAARSTTRGATCRTRAWRKPWR